MDTKTDALIRQAFREEMPDVTKFIIAQRVASVEDSDLILIMDGGKIAAMGKHYQEVYYSQNRMGASAADLAKTEGGAKGTAFEGKGGDRA